jgi:hypothetical protein
MPAKFQLNTALTREWREMLDAIHANGRGPNDQAVMKMLLAALHDYWRKFHVLPSPMEIVANVNPDDLRAAADYITEKRGGARHGVISLPNPGEEMSAAETALPYLAHPEKRSDRLLSEEIKKKSRGTEHK